VAEGSVRDPMRADLVGLALASDRVLPSYVPLGHAEGPNLEMVAGESAQVSATALGPPLAEPGLRKYAHNAKSQMVLLARHGVELRGLDFDTMIAAYLLESGQRAQELRDLAWSRLQEEVPPLASLIGTGKGALTLREVAIGKAARYAGREAELICRLVPTLGKELAECGLE